MTDEKDSILLSVKKMLGITGDYNYFDNDIIMHINTVISILKQMGLKTDLVVANEKQTWRKLYGDDDIYGFIKTFVYLRVKLLFDPPASSSVSDAINRQIQELEWRIYSELDGLNERKENTT